MSGMLLIIIAGHEGIGHIVAIGSNTIGSPVSVGDRVGMKWFANACLKYVNPYSLSLSLDNLIAFFYLLFHLFFVAHFFRQRCEMCRLGWESCCPIARRDSHGYTVDGTFAEYTASLIYSGYQHVLTDITQKCWVDYVTPIPEGLDSAAVTPLLCAVRLEKSTY